MQSEVRATPEVALTSVQYMYVANVCDAEQSWSIFKSCPINLGTLCIFKP